MKKVIEIDSKWTLASFSKFYGQIWVGFCLNTGKRSFLKASRLVDSKTPKHNDFDQFWKFKFHFEHFPRTHNFLVKEYRCLKKVIEIDSKWTLASFSKFYGQIWVGFCLNTGKRSFLKASRLVDSKTPKHNDFDQFWKFKFHFEHFPRTKNLLVLTDPLIYLYLFQNHRQTFSWLGERPSSHLKVNKMWFGPNIKYILEPFWGDFCCCISCFLACFTCIDPIIVTISFLMLI